MPNVTVRTVPAPRRVKAKAKGPSIAEQNDAAVQAFADGDKHAVEQHAAETKADYQTRRADVKAAGKMKAWFKNLPRCKDGDVVTWLEEVVAYSGIHPRSIADAKPILEAGGVKPELLTEPILKNAVVTCLPVAQEWAAVQTEAGRPARIITSGEGNWYDYKRPDVLVRAPLPVSPSASAPHSTLKTAAKPEAGAKSPAKPGSPKKPGVIAAIVRELTAASKKKPATKEAVLAVLVSEFPERGEKAMRSTISSQVPSGLKTEKGLIVQTDGKGGWWLPK